MDINATRERMEMIWHFSSIFPRESHMGSDVWKRYNPSIIWPIETIRNNYLVHTKYSHSNEKMMLAYCQTLLNSIQKGDKGEGFLTVKGLNYNFFQMDWAFENSALLGKPSLPSMIGTISNLSKLIKQARQLSSLRQEINDIYCKVVYPALTASGASIWFNIEDEAENHIEIREIKPFNLVNIDLIIESLIYLSQNLQDIVCEYKDSQEAKNNINDEIVRQIKYKEFIDADTPKHTHFFINGICFNCGVSKIAAEGFAWNKCKNDKSHNFVDGKCRRCGVSLTAAQHFRWKICKKA